MLPQNLLKSLLPLLPFVACPLFEASADEPVEMAQSYPEVQRLEEGINWPRGQALPTFAKAARELDSIYTGDLTIAERLLFSALQGHVNRKQPRILLLPNQSHTWVRTDTLNYKIGRRFNRSDKYELLEKYKDEVKGIVLYDPSKSPHYRNLAATVANIEEALPATAEVAELLKEKGIRLDVTADLTELEMTEPIPIYEHLLENYWERCTKRVILSARPTDKGDHHHTRDMMAATKGAVVWLDCRESDERAVFERFLGDMEAGNAIALGWYTSERSGISTASKFGIGTLPADFFNSITAHSGADLVIHTPVIPKKPELEDKTYIAFFISDGDNIQYNQHAMRKYWDTGAQYRGQIPLTWTIAPALADAAPGILNYYYKTSKPEDCFATGPSGMGYMMPVNTLKEEGAPVGVNLESKEAMQGYAKMTETYLQRSGLRVMTIWDEANEMHREEYEKAGRTLYGATVQNFKDMPSVESSVEGRRMPFEKLRIPYTGTREHLMRDIANFMENANKREPTFASYQMNIWEVLKPEVLVGVKKELKELYGDRVQLVRGDHYFALMNEANRRPYNQAMNAALKVEGSSGEVEKVADGSQSTLWEPDEETAWLSFDLGEKKEISRYVIRHAGASRHDRALNNSAIEVKHSNNGKNWRPLDRIVKNTANVNDREFDPIEAQYLAFRFAGGDDKEVRVGEVEIYAK